MVINEIKKNKIDGDFRDKLFAHKFYVYSLKDESNSKVFYVGKGQKYRCFQSIYAFRNNRIINNNHHLFNRIKKLFENNTNIVCEILFSSDCEDDCYNKESDTIEFYGINNLCNIELSHNGFKHTLDTINKIRKSNTGKKVSDSTKEKLRKINLGNKHSEETKNKVSESLRRQHAAGTRTFRFNNDKDFYIKMSKLHKGRKNSKEVIAKMSKAQLGKIISQEQRENIRKKLTKKRIIITKKCKWCNNEFKVEAIENSKNKTLYKNTCCSRGCSAKLSHIKKKRIIIANKCKRCGKEFKFEIVENTKNKRSYRTYCSRSCFLNKENNIKAYKCT